MFPHFWRPKGDYIVKMARALYDPGRDLPQKAGSKAARKHYRSPVCGTVTGCGSEWTPAHPVGHTNLGLNLTLFMGPGIEIRVNPVRIGRPDNPSPSLYIGEDRSI